MDRFLTYTGRQPIWLDDLNFIQDSIKNEIQKLVQGFTGFSQDDILILTGCELKEENGDYSVSDGVIYYKGEILIVRGDYCQSQYKDKQSIRIETMYDRAGDRVMFDSKEEVSCYQRKWAAIYTDINNTEKHLQDYRRLSDIIEEHNNRKVISAENYTNIPVTGGGYTMEIVLYRVHDIFYLDWALDGEVYECQNLEMSIPLSSLSDYDINKLGTTRLDSPVGYWRYCTTYGTAHIIQNDSSVVPVALQVQTYRDDDKGVLKLICKFLCGSKTFTAGAKCDFTLKLNTL